MERCRLIGGAGRIGRRAAHGRAGGLASRPGTLARFDTATVCNALEVLRPECRSAGYTRRPLLAARPDLAPVVGLARVGAIRAAAAPRPGSVPERVSWYEYVAAAELPTMVVIEDRDVEPGTGAFWGEVNSLVHKTLGAAGCVTNGSFRDVTALADGFQILGSHVGPSHAHVHIVEFGKPVMCAACSSTTTTSCMPTTRERW